jgi:4-amino-4-deoxy-L-arabinose transferase-like glycosyltransferase
VIESRVPPRLLWGLAALIFISRVAVILYLRTFAGDAALYEHDELARSLVAGDGFQFRFFSDVAEPSTHQAPAMAMLLALGYALFGVGTQLSVAFVEIVLAALTTAGAMALGTIAYHWWGRRGLIVAMLGFFAYPAFAYMPTRVQSVNWSLSFVLLMLAGFVAMAERRGDKRVALATGAVAALGALGEPILAAPFGLCFLVLLWQRRDAWRLPACVAVAYIAVVTPWMVRNAVTLGYYGFVKGSFSYVAWQGNHIGASGTDKREVQGPTARALAWRVGGADLEAHLDSARAQAVSVDVILSAEDSATLRALPNEQARMAWFRDQLRAELKAAPGQYVKVVLKRAKMLVWFDPTNPRSFVAAYRVPWLLLVALALAGWMWWRREERPAGAAMWAATLGGLIAVHLLVIMSARFRLPMEALLLLPATFALTRWRRAPNVT